MEMNGSEGTIMNKKGHVISIENVSRKNEFGENCVYRDYYNLSKFVILVILENTRCCLFKKERTTKKNKYFLFSHISTINTAK